MTALHPDVKPFYHEPTGPGCLPPADANGVAYLKTPIDVLGRPAPSG